LLFTAYNILLHFKAPVLATSAFSLGVSAGFDGWVFVVLAALLDAPVLLVYVLEEVSTE
jgi:NCAIR mutase (PurE)-related protein